MSSLRLPVLTPRTFYRVTIVALVALWVIVLTGAAVRLTNSGLGCPDWPRCYGGLTPPLQFHTIIEYSNRVISGVVSVIAIGTFVLAFLRRPFRRDLALVAALLPLGVVSQAVLGGLTVEKDLAPGYVMGHFGLSMLLLLAVVALAWRARHEPGERPRSSDRLTVWSVRALLPLTAIVLGMGTAATAAGPHSGGVSGDHVNRLTFKGADTLEWMVHRHGSIAALLGIATIAVWFLLQRRKGDREVIQAITVTGVLMAAQGLVGSVQYELKLPGDMVWIHVGLSALTWLTVCWAVAAAGRLTPFRASAGEPAAAPSQESLRDEIARLAER